MSGQTRTALVTGASSGIGAAAVRALARDGWHVIAAARRLDRCRELADETGGAAIELDVTDPGSVNAMADAISDVDLVVHSAGGAFGLEPVAEADEENWQRMFDTNVLGVERVTKALLPKLEAGAGGHIVVIGSVAGVEVYPGGAGYTAAKHAVNALCRTLRLELLGKPIRVTEIAPGLVETEFSLVRFEGDSDKADAVYDGLEPLTGEDIAETIAFVVSRPPNVNIDYLAVKPLAQATARDLHRG